MIAGVDEAGRGCLAGPVVAAAVILPAHYDLPYLGDSKTLSVSRRDMLAPAIRACAVAWGLGVVWPRAIERINILQATFWAMAQAVRGLYRVPGIRLNTVRIDGNATIPPPVLSTCLGCLDCLGGIPLPRQEALVRGDAREPCIAAASILAKTFRDRIMLSLHKRWSLYGFDKHKGYATEGHRRAVREHGPCPQHRMTFAGVKEFDYCLFLKSGNLSPLYKFKPALA